MAREVIRHVQNARKDADLQMEDRIALHLGTESPALDKSIASHRDYIAAETLVAEWSDKPLEGDAYQTTVKVGGASVADRVAAGVGRLLPGAALLHSR